MTRTKNVRGLTLVLKKIETCVRSTMDTDDFTTRGCFRGGCIAEEHFDVLVEIARAGIECLTVERRHRLFGALRAISDRRAEQGFDLMDSESLDMAYVAMAAEVAKERIAAT